MSPKAWVSTFFCIVFIRMCMENFSSRSPLSIVVSDIQAQVHHILFFFVTLLLYSVIIHFFSSRDIARVLKVMIFGFMVIWISPIMDMILSKGAGFEMAYLFKPTTDLVFDFFTYFGPMTLPGVTIGLRIEGVFIFGLTFLYVKWATGRIDKAIFATICVYSMTFLLSALPHFLGFDGTNTSISIAVLIHNSLMGQNFIDAPIGFSTIQRTVNMYFDGIMTQTLYLLLVPTTYYLARMWDKQKVYAIIKNSRPERFLFYFSMILLGMALGFERNSTLLQHINWLDIANIGTLFTAYYFAWMYAVGVNDIVDVESDSVTNTDRPLVTKEITIDEQKFSNAIFLFLAILGAYIAGQYPYIMVVTCVALSYIYSSPPLQLKRFAIINPFLISLAALTAVFSGFYTIHTSPLLEAFPITWALLIVVVITLLANVKDIKDYEGDKRAGVFTIPVLFGVEKAKRIIGWMTVFALICVPLISGVSGLWLPSLVFGLISYKRIQKITGTDVGLFKVYFAYIVVCVLWTMDIGKVLEFFTH